MALARCNLRGAKFYLVEYPEDALPDQITAGIIVSQDRTLLQQCSVVYSLDDGYLSKVNMNN